MSDEQSKLPSTLSGAPTMALVPPGKCQFHSEFVAVPLLKKWHVSETSSVLRYGLPDSSKPLDLSTCACILVKVSLRNAQSGEPEAAVRPYTPISTNKQVGSFDLLVKNYDGGVSKVLCEMNEGETVDFKHIPFNVKIQAPFSNKRIGMLVGGTGITPMIQALHAILGDPSSKTVVDMLYGSRVSTDVLGKEMLDAWATHERLRVTHVLSHEPKDSTWKGERGFIAEELLAKHMPPPEDDDSLIFVCGPPPMYAALCGARDEAELKGTLAKMGYKASQVYKF